MERYAGLDYGGAVEGIYVSSGYGAHAEGGRGHVKRKVAVWVYVVLRPQGSAETRRVGHWRYDDPPAGHKSAQPYKLPLFVTPLVEPLRAVLIRAICGGRGLIVGRGAGGGCEEKFGRMEDGERTDCLVTVNFAGEEDVGDMGGTLSIVSLILHQLCIHQGTKGVKTILYNHEVIVACRCRLATCTDGWEPVNILRGVYFDELGERRGERLHSRNHGVIWNVGEGQGGGGSWEGDEEEEEDVVEEDD
mmetsp:Transcript_23050/g.47783  ORF Transcript_23050/g.47783 Transcript_23050/m.47783 type:complete len:247 (-) Transcript_23050:197-937(-)